MYGKTIHSAYGPRQGGAAAEPTATEGMQGPGSTRAARMVSVGMNNPQQTRQGEKGPDPRPEARDFNHNHNQPHIQIN